MHPIHKLLNQAGAKYVKRVLSQKAKTGRRKISRPHLAKLKSIPKGFSGTVEASLARSIAKAVPKIVPMGMPIRRDKINPIAKQLAMKFIKRR